MVRGFTVFPADDAFSFAKWRPDMAKLIVSGNDWQRIKPLGEHVLLLATLLDPYCQPGHAKRGGPGGHSCKMRDETVEGL